MRLAFFLLVLANLIFFVWSAGYLGGQEEGREPQRLQNQLHPEMMTVTPVAPAEAAPAAPAPAQPAPPAQTPEPPVVPPPATSQAAPAQPVAAAQTAATAGAAQPAVLTQPPVAPAVRSPVPVVAMPPPSHVCKRVEGVAAKDAGVFQQSLRSAGFIVAVIPTDERSYWVNIPALPKATADKKAGELKALGVTDFHVIGEGSGFVISLGIFKDEAAATQLLQGLAKKGVKSARVEARTKAPSALRLELRAPADLFAQRLPKVLVAAPGASTTDCP